MFKFLKAIAELQRLDDYLSMEHPHAQGKTVYDRATYVLERQQSDLKFAMRRLERYKTHASYVSREQDAVDMHRMMGLQRGLQNANAGGEIWPAPANAAWPFSTHGADVFPETNVPPPFKTGGGGDFGGGGAQGAWDAPQSAADAGQDVALGALAGLGGVIGGASWNPDTQVAPAPESPAQPESSWSSSSDTGSSDSGSSSSDSGSSDSGSSSSD